jgi:hypothetical protein
MEGVALLLNGRHAVLRRLTLHPARRSATQHHLTTIEQQRDPFHRC